MEISVKKKCCGQFEAHNVAIGVVDIFFYNLGMSKTFWKYRSPLPPDRDQFTYILLEGQQSQNDPNLLKIARTPPKLAKIAQMSEIVTSSFINQFRRFFW